MFDLEKKIVDNLPCFDDHEPDQGHRERFAAKLALEKGGKKKMLNISMFSKIAAVIVLLFSVSYIFLMPTGVVDPGKLYVTQIEYSNDMIEIQKYYDELSNSRLEEIDGLAQNENEALRLKKMAQAKMEKLDANLSMIEKEYMKNPQSEELREAIISNKKMKSEVANNIVEQLDNAQRGYHAGEIYSNF